MRIKKIFLLGMPASGKSSIGRFLSAQLRLDFYDLDQIIVDQAGMPITEIFSNHGESYFRNLEREALVGVIERKDSFVLATGGGAPCFFNNMELMNEQGITVFLDVDLNDLYNKLVSKGTHKRPLLKDKTPTELREELYNRYEYRYPFYSRAKICLKQRFQNVSDRVNQIIFAIKTLEE
jgi:shikimate kinase